MSITERIQQVVSELPPAQQSKVLDFVCALRHNLSDEDEASGEAGAKLAAMILEPEDFSGWEGDVASG